MTQALGSADGVVVDGPPEDRYGEVLTDRALALVALLHRSFDDRRRQLLDARQERYAQLANGAMLGFLDETKDIREDPTWRVAAPAPGLVDRRVEITGPTEKKMTINALNSGAKVWLADQEDANTPHWGNVVQGPLNLGDALAGTLDFTSPEGKDYKVRDLSTTIVVRPRGWHLPEKHILVDGERTSGSLVDFALHLEHNGAGAARRRQGSVLLPAEDGEPPRGAALERRVRHRPGLPRHPAGHDPGHRADRDLPGRVRDGGDPLRAARPLRRAERRALGLPVLGDQEVPDPGPRTSCCPTATR